MSLASTNTGPAPRVSVVIPTRDRPKLLSAAIASARAQTFTDIEIVVVINGPDNPSTPAVMEAAAGCRIERITASGIAVALNAGIAAARGEWIALLDDDDLWAPNWLAVALDVAGNTGADVVFSDMVLFDDTGGYAMPQVRPPAHLSVPEAFTLAVHSGCSAAFLRRSAVQAVGGFDPAFKSPDFDLWMRLAWRYRVVWADQYLVWVRQHTQNTSRALSWVASTIPVQWKAFKTLPPDLRYMRPRLLATMMNVIAKGTTAHLRRLRRPFRQPTAAFDSGLRPPGDPRHSGADARTKLL